MKICNKEILIHGRLFRVARLDADSYEAVADPEAIIDGLRKCGRRIDLFTFMQVMPETEPKFTYRMEWDNLAVLPVSNFEHWWTRQIRSFPRNRARQAEKKGVTIREVILDEALVRGISAIYNECPVRQGRPFVHYGKDLKSVGEELATFLDSSVFIGAFLGNDLIGFIKMTMDESRIQANIMNIISMMRHRYKAPTNGLLAQAVRSCETRGIKYLAYQKFSYGKKKEDSLRNFKEINGFHQANLPRYYIPLSARGWVALHLRLHKSFSDRIPEAITARLRDLRNHWYNRKLQSNAETS